MEISFYPHTKNKYLEVCVLQVHDCYQNRRRENKMMFQLLGANAQAGLNKTMPKTYTWYAPAPDSEGVRGSVEPPLTKNFIFMEIWG